jgi:hypothetical protein
MHVLDFLQKLQENDLLTNVNLDIGYGERDQMLPVLDKILPLISSIYSINFEMFDNIYNNKQSQLLLKTMVAQTKILAIDWLDLCSHDLLDLSLSSGTPTPLTTHGRTKLIGTVLGFTNQEMMECRGH